MGAVLGALVLVAVVAGIVWYKRRSAADSWSSDADSQPKAGFGSVRGDGRTTVMVDSPAKAASEGAAAPSGEAAEPGAGDARR